MAAGGSQGQEEQFRWGDNPGQDRVRQEESLRGACTSNLPISLCLMWNTLTTKKGNGIKLTRWERHWESLSGIWDRCALSHKWAPPFTSSWRGRVCWTSKHDHLAVYYIQLLPMLSLQENMWDCSAFQTFKEFRPAHHRCCPSQEDLGLSESVTLYLNWYKNYGFKHSIY